MNHRAPIIDDPSKGPGINDIAERLVRHVASQNPFTAAIYEEMEPEIQLVLKENLGNQHPDFEKVHRIASRAGRMIQNAQQKANAAKGEKKA